MRIHSQENCKEVNLSEATIKREDIDKRPLGFTITSRSRKYSIQALNDEDLAKWLTSLSAVVSVPAHSFHVEQVMYCLQIRFSRDNLPNAVPESDGEMEEIPVGRIELDVDKEVQDDHIERSGWLWKEGRKVTTWKRRWFTLAGQTLSYYETDKVRLVVTIAKSRRILIHEGS